MSIKRNYLDPAEFERKFLLFIEGEEGAGGGGGEEGKGGEGGEGAPAASEGKDASEGEGGEKAPEGNWRDAIKDPGARKFAEDSADLDHLAKRAMDMRKRLSSSISKPGENASEEEVAAYRKALGVPDKPEAYEFPDLPEGVDLTDDIKASRETWAGRFHALGISSDQAKALAKMVNDDDLAAQQAILDQDKAYSEEQEALLKKDWPGQEYEKNKAVANRAFEELASRAGVSIDDLKQIETKSGRFLMDDADMVRLFAALGREMGESRLGSVLSASDREQTEGRIAEVRKKISEAQAAGDSRKANELYQEEQKLISSLKGSQPVVGSQGRAA